MPPPSRYLFELKIKENSGGACEECACDHVALLSSFHPEGSQQEPNGIILQSECRQRAHLKCKQFTKEQLCAAKLACCGSAREADIRVMLPFVKQDEYCESLPYLTLLTCSHKSLLD